MMVNVNFLRLLDKFLVIFLILLYPIKSFFINKKKSISKNILIIRLWGMGDSINSLPLCKQVYEKKFNVYVLTTKNVSPIFENQKFIKKIYVFNYLNPLSIFSLIYSLRKFNFDYILDTEQFMNISTLLSIFSNSKNLVGFNHLFRSNFYTSKKEYSEFEHFVENFAKLSEDFTSKKIPKSLIPLKYKHINTQKLDFKLSEFKDKKLIGIHLGTASTALGRRWSEINFQNLANKISKNYSDVTIIFTGLNPEKEIYDKIKKNLNLNSSINLINKLSKEEFAYLLTNLDVFISNDTGPMHISAAMGTKTIGLFGLNNPLKVGPWPLNKNISLYKNPNNNPIINNKFSIYPEDKYSTINLISVDEVYNEVKKILK